MENPTEFDLNDAIQSWRNQFSQMEGVSRENAEELEGHLRDSIEALQSRGGLSQEEAFLVASRRMGGGTALTEEFVKVNGKEVLMSRLFWMLVGVLGWSLFSSVTHLMILNRLTFAWLDSWAPTPFVSKITVICGFVLHLSVAVGMAGLCWALIAKSGERIRRRVVVFLQHRAVLVLVCMMLIRLLCNLTISSEMKMATRQVGPAKPIFQRDRPVLSPSSSGLILAAQFSDPTLMLSLTALAAYLARKQFGAKKGLAVSE